MQFARVSTAMALCLMLSVCALHGHSVAAQGGTGAGVSGAGLPGDPGDGPAAARRVVALGEPSPGGWASQRRATGPACAACTVNPGPAAGTSPASNPMAHKPLAMLGVLAGLLAMAALEHRLARHVRLRPASS
jgi:hypothetical protein